MPHWLENEGAEVLSGSERKSRQQLTKAEWECAFFDSREGKKASLAKEEGAEKRALWL